MTNEAKEAMTTALAWMERGDPRTIASQYRKLVLAIGAHLDNDRGWHLRAAEALGVSKTLVSFIVHEKAIATREVAARAVTRIGIEPSYFTNAERPAPSSYLIPRSVARKTRSDSQAAKSMRVASALESQRYHALIMQLADEHERRYGWKAEVAKTLGVDPSYITKILAGAGSRRVGTAAIEYAAKALHIDRAFFAESRPYHYSAFGTDGTTSIADQIDPSSHHASTVEVLPEEREDRETWRAFYAAMLTDESQTVQTAATNADEALRAYRERFPRAMREIGGAS